MQSKKYHVGTIPSELVFLQFRDKAGEPLIVKPSRDYMLTEEQVTALVERVGPKFAVEVRTEEAFKAWQTSITGVASEVGDHSFDDLISAEPVPTKPASRGR